MREATFTEVGANVDVYIRNVDHSDPANWEHLEEVADAFAKADYVAEANAWFVAFRKSEQAAELTQDIFVEQLVAWGMTEEGSQFMLNDVDILDENKLLKPAAD